MRVHCVKFYSRTPSVWGIDRTVLFFSGFTPSHTFIKEGNSFNNVIPAVINPLFKIILHNSSKSHRVCVTLVIKSRKAHSYFYEFCYNISVERADYLSYTDRFGTAFFTTTVRSSVYVSWTVLTKFR